MTKDVGFLFDLDGVITDTATFHFRAWSELSESLGIHLTPTFNEQLKGISRVDSLERILTYGGQQNQYSAVEKEALATKKNTVYLKLLENISPADILPGVLPFLDQAEAHKIPCAIASASFNAPFILEKLGIANRFRYIVDPGTLKKGKPDPEIFIKAAEGIHISPRNAVGFEDSQAGIESIKKAGEYAVGISVDNSLQGADIQVASLDQINIDNLIETIRER